MDKTNEELKWEADLANILTEARLSRSMTQKELSAKTGINQADISRLENGTRNPSLRFLRRLADGMDMELQITFVPKIQN